MRSPVTRQRPSRILALVCAGGVMTQFSPAAAGFLCARPVSPGPPAARRDHRGR